MEDVDLRPMLTVYVIYFRVAGPPLTATGQRAQEADLTHRAASSEDLRTLRHAGRRSPQARDPGPAEEARPLGLVFEAAAQAPGKIAGNGALRPRTLTRLRGSRDGKDG